MSRHLSVRIAWHDNGWDGNICERPKSNWYCIGTKSLLSSRLAKNRNIAIEQQYSGSPVDGELPEGYLAPCFWGINAFGSEPRKIIHRHAFEDLKNSHTITEELPPYSVFTWPFRLSFNHTEETRSQHGKYHKKLENKIGEFFAAHRPDESLVFFYMNFDNPISGEDPLYALVGCGLLSEIGPSTHFKFEEEELKSWRNKEGMQNFPTVNWARRLSLNPETVIRLPYQEYLSHVRRNPAEESKLDEIRVLIDEPALQQSFKYVCESMSDDHCLFLLYMLRRSFEHVLTHGLVSGIEDELARIDLLIEHVWEQRTPYPGLASSVSILGMLGRGSETPADDDAKELLSVLWDASLDSEENFDRIFDTVESSANVEMKSKKARNFLKKVRRGSDDHQHLIPLLKKLSLFTLSTQQMYRVLHSSESGDTSVWGGASISLKELSQNPYILAENYVSRLEDNQSRLSLYESPILEDSDIALFNIDAGMFPEEKYLDEHAELHDLSPVGPERLRALALNQLRLAAFGRGDSFCSTKTIEKAVVEYPLFYKSKISVPAGALVSERFRAHFKNRIDVIDGNNDTHFYLKEVKQSEELIQRVFEQLAELPDINTDLSWTSEWIAKERAQLEGRIKGFNGEIFEKERRDLVEKFFQRPFSIITGRPGSGKTFAIGQIIDRLIQSREPVCLLAPTGKAVLRLRAFTHATPQTIDRLLSNPWVTWKDAFPDRIRSTSIDRFPVIKNLIIDESSMVDLCKLATLFRMLEAKGLNKLKRLILIGDENQLPPIDVGRPFHDVVDWVKADPVRKRKHFVHLESNCRQENDQSILEAADLFAGRNKYYTELLDQLKKGGQISEGLDVILWDTQEDLEAAIKKRLNQTIEEQTSKTAESAHHGLNLLMGLDDEGNVPHQNAQSITPERFQIITPYSVRYHFAATALSQFIRQEYKENWWPTTASFGHSDKIIRLTNRYDSHNRLVLSNGSIGIVNHKKGAKHPKAFFPVEENSYTLRADSDQEDFNLAYAITIHKSQGSEFNHTFVVIPGHKPLLSRELVYTALTRSKKSLTIFLQKDNRESPLEYARKKSSVMQRNSSIFELPVDKSHMLEPEPGKFVDSKIEYIIYKALSVARDAGKLHFFHHQPLKLKTEKGEIEVKPDFTVHTKSRKTWYWEHLGMLDLRMYADKWQIKRETYSRNGFGDSLVTSDDLNGVKSVSVENLVQAICEDTLAPSPLSAYSNFHYRLWE